MANQLQDVIPQLLAQGLMALRENTVMPWLVNTDYSDTAAEKGTAITIPIPSAIQAQQVSPGNTPPNTGDISPTHATITMDKWYEAPFYLTDKEMMEVMSGTIPMQASEAIKALANQVDKDLLSLYKEVYGFVGSPGTTPFVSDTSDATAVRRVLNVQLAPPRDRRMVIDPDAEANALNLRAFQDMSFSGDARGIIEGQINRKLGFDWFMDQNVQTHTSGTLSDGVVSGAHAIGVSSVTVSSTNGGTLNQGDIITFAGHNQTYVVTSDVSINATSSASVPIRPTLKVALSGNEAVTLKDSHVVNIGFHRDAFAFVSRPLADNTDGLGNMIVTTGDPVSGLTLRLEVSREHKRTRFSYDILYGVACVRPELACRLAG